MHASSATTCAPVRSLIRCVLVVYMAMVLAPAAVVTSFLLQRERITKEFCVQRFKPVEQNCCKGSCHLREQLNEPASPEQAPGTSPRMEVRVEPAIIVGLRPVTFELAAVTRAFAPSARWCVRVGYPSISEPVPWG